MTKHKLTFDDLLEDDDDIYFAIYSWQKIYKLAFHLNKSMKINLERRRKNILETEENAGFPLFEFNQPELDVNWYLFSNSQREIVLEENNTRLDLFSEQLIYQEKKDYLIPEMKEIPFFLRINKWPGMDNRQILTNLIKTKGIQSSHEVEITKIRSKNNLIF